MAPRTKGHLQAIYGAIVALLAGFLPSNPAVPEPVFYIVMVAGMLLVCDGLKRTTRKGREY